MSARKCIGFACAAMLLVAPIVAIAAEGALTGAAGETQTGLAAVYNKRLNGHKTASGAHYNAKALTAAHQTLPFGTKVKVTNLKNNKTVTVKINDRGPTQAGRIVDLSGAAAKALGIKSNATAEVKLEVVGAAKS